MLNLLKLPKFQMVQLHLKNINKQGVNNRNLLLNPTTSQLYEIAFLNEPPSDPSTLPTRVANNGALCAYSGSKKERDAANWRIVRDQDTENIVNWNSKHNIAIKRDTFRLIEQMAVDYINHNRRCIVIDGYIGWEPQSRLKVRSFCTRSYHALFLRNMLIEPTPKELLEDFSKGVDVHVFNGGEMGISKNIEGLTTNAVTALDLNEKKLAIMGTQFAGEMKKSLFKILHHHFPKKGYLTLRASATKGKDGNTTLVLGRSALGKSALSVHDGRGLISDDEVIWGEKGIEGAEGGSYTKVLDLSPETDPNTYEAIRYGALVENTNFFPETRDINFHDSSITTNLRAVFPLHHLKNAVVPAVGSHPKNIVFLVCDTKGVLPVISKLNPEQATYHFLSGYTAKVSDRAAPQQRFSACFGESSLPLHPTTYAKLFHQKIKQHGTNVWLVNSGWLKNKNGALNMIQLPELTKILNEIHSGRLQNIETSKLPHFGFEVPVALEGFSEEFTNPVSGWASKIEYNEMLGATAIDFIKNFKEKYEGKYGNGEEQIVRAGPQV